MTTITIVGNLTADPELRFTPNGAAVANFTVAHTPRVFDKQANEWRDGEALFLNCSIWRQYAENVAETLRKGMQVIVQGKLKSRSYEDREGQKRTVFEIEAEDVGPTLRFATAAVNRAARSNSGGGAQQWAPAQQQPAGDPWAAQDQGQRAAQYDQPPF